MSLFFYSIGGHVQIWMINFGAHSIVFIGHFGLWYMGLKNVCVIPFFPTTIEKWEIYGTILFEL
jgi:hypothetical protein